MSHRMDPARKRALRSRSQESRRRDFLSSASRHYRPAVEPLEERAMLAVFDVINTADSGAGSLRQAILDANATANDVGIPDEIHFNIPGAGPHTIQPATELTTVTEAVVIDGTTEPDFAGTPVIE